MNLKNLMHEGIETLSITLTKEEIKQKYISRALGILNQLLMDATLARYYQERVSISIVGFENRWEKEWEIVEIKDFINELDDKFPYWFFFIRKEGLDLYTILKCFLLPFLVPEARKKRNGPLLVDYMEKRGIPAMNQICEFVGMSDQEHRELTLRLIAYLKENNPVE